MYLSPGVHGVVVVHGIGDQKPGDTLAEFTKAICDTLINAPKGDILPKIQIQPDVCGTPPSVILQINSPYGEEATWLCREAYWNDAFPAPAATRVLWWGVNQNFKKQLDSILEMLQDPINEKLPTDVEKEKAREKAENKVETTKSFSLSKKSKAGVRAKSGIISTIALIPLIPLMYLVLGLIWILHYVPSIGPLDKIIGWIRKVDPFLSSSLGDVEMYIDHEIWSANARARVETIVIDMLQDNEIQDITIVAHSMGAVVAYDALTEGGNIAESIIRMRNNNVKKITFISVGGAINRVFTLVGQSETARIIDKDDNEIKFNSLQITKPLGKAITGYGDEKYVEHPENKFFWLDLFARRDPVPAGPVLKEVVNRAGIDPKKQMKERRVVNKDSMIFDHVSYWENQELVMPRVVRAINGGNHYPWPEVGITETKVRRRIKKALKIANLSEIILFIVGLGLITFVCLKISGII